MLQLLKLGSLKRSCIIEITGWPAESVNGVLMYLRKEGKIIHRKEKWRLRVNTNAIQKVSSQNSTQQASRGS